jgi:hypothetical protein
MPGLSQFAAVDEPAHVKAKHINRRVAARRDPEFNAGNAALPEAISFSVWQSPTATLMHSPAHEVLVSLPQLDRSLTEMKSFLPNTLQ